MPTVSIPLWTHTIEPVAMEFFLMILIQCSTFLQKYLHVKNYGNFLRSHWETHDSHASCVKHTYFGVNQFAVFSWCSLHYFRISFTYHCINDHYLSLERKRNLFLTIHFLMPTTVHFHTESGKYTAFFKSNSCPSLAIIESVYTHNRHIDSIIYLHIHLHMQKKFNGVLIYTLNDQAET